MWTLKLILSIPVMIATSLIIALRHLIGEVTDSDESEVDQLLEKEYAKYGKKSDKE